ncbi:MAG: hypothetical protein EBU84_20170, partial [Actinobacteria bacterium]|nr:hypothetical protein [Actinomycetota bacterium]
MNTTKTNSKKPNTTKTNSKKPNTTKTNSKKPNTTKTNAKRPNTTKTNAKKPNTTKTNAKKPNTTKTNAKKPNTTKTNAKKPKPKYVSELKKYYKNKSKMIGGKEFDSSDFDSIMNYILDKLSNKIKNKSIPVVSQEQKHLIMLYGPPASGKSIAKNIMLYKLNIDSENYIDINLDDIIGDDETYKKTIDTLKKYDLTMKIEQQATEVYSNTRKKANLVFELLLFITRLYDISLVVEVTGSSLCAMVWWDKILSFFKSKDYIISLIYPFVTNEETLISRAQQRGKNIYRFISDEIMINSILGAKKNINKILEESITNALFDNIYIYNNEDEKFNTLSNEKKQ